MFQALFNSLSGLFSFSKSLSTVSDNISNMNTPGFRGSDSFFSNVNGNRGSRIAGDGLRVKEGDIRQTGNPTDVAIDGDGYFVLKDKEGNLYYTRAGQFRFDDSGMLVDTVNQYQVMGMDGSGALAPINFSTYQMLPAAATTGIHFTGNLAPGSTGANANSITVYDANGTAHTLTATFTSKTTTPPSFDVVIKDETDATLGSGTVTFAADGTPTATGNPMTITANWGAAQSIKIDFGTPGALDGLKALSGMASTVTTKVDDGHAVLGVTGMSFDEKGVLQLTYSQTEKRQGPQLALALFPNEASLHLSGGRLISGSAVADKEFGRPGEGRFGRIAGGSLEMSNVDLTQEFADMIIIQRGYQASSRVMTVSNEMLDQLYNSIRGG